MITQALQKQGLKQFCAKHNIKARHSADGKVVSLKYADLGVDFTNPLIRQCRGIILDATTFDIVARPYEKWFTYDDPACLRALQAMNWGEALAYNKYDGSLAIVYWRDDLAQWCVGSSGTPDGKWLTKGGKYTFEELFWLGLECNAEQFDILFANRANTYLFEVCSPEQSIVHNYSSTRSVLHGIIETASGKYVPLEGALLGKAHIVAKADCIADLYNSLDKLSLEEGLIIRDNAGNAIKMKTKQYLHLHRLASSRNAMLQAIKSSAGGSSLDKELLQIWPEANAICRRVKQWLNQAYTLYKNTEQSSDKELGLMQGIDEYKPAIFALRKHSTLPLQYITEHMSFSTFCNLFDKNY